MRDSSQPPAIAPKDGKLKVLHLSYSDGAGGAFEAAYRIHRAMHCESDVISEMWVQLRCNDDVTVRGFVGGMQQSAARVKRLTARMAVKLQATPNRILHSLAALPSGLSSMINRSDADVVNLHWVNNEMLSVGDIGKITKPLVWTLHDMWPFCGAEHYCSDDRWRSGYTRGNRPVHHRGLDLNRWTWGRKKKAWNRVISLVSPSKWLAECAAQSALFAGSAVDVIPYPIDLGLWIPRDKAIAKRKFGLPEDRSVIVFGAVGGIRDPRKGFDLLLEAVRKLKELGKKPVVAVFGPAVNVAKESAECDIVPLGYLNGPQELGPAYSAADVFALPSRQDNLPLTAMEALACGTPVVAFDSSGPSSMIVTHVNGYLAKALDTTDFARGLDWVLTNARGGALRERSRLSAMDMFDPSRVASSYQAVYERVLGRR